MVKKLFPKFLRIVLKGFLPLYSKNSLKMLTLPDETIYLSLKKRKRELDQLCIIVL